MFEEKLESKKIIELIEKLSAKKNELKTSAEALGPTSLDHEKYVILSSLLINIRHSIHTYNNKILSEDPIKELRDYINLLRQLVEYIKAINNNHEYKNVLSTFRNKNREHVRTALQVGKWGVIGVAFTFSGLAGGASAVLASNGINSIIDNKTDLKSPLPETYILLNQLLQVLDLTIKDLILSMNLSQLLNHEGELSNEDNMVCPITRELIKNPYRCMLDEYSYEKEHLEQWLTQHRTSPVTRKAMKLHETINDVMIPNRNLKEIITNYKLYLQSTMHTVENEKSMKMRS